LRNNNRFKMKYRAIYFCLSFLLCVVLPVNSQPDIKYYLPENVEYNPAIPTPDSILGFAVGEWHVTHDKLVEYMYALDKASDRISLEVTGHTHEGRKLLLLTITSPDNHTKIESIRKDHIQLTNPAQSSSLDVTNMPAVFYLGCSIHGNEPSGSNAGLLVAYHLAAAQGKEIEQQLKNTIILFDPSFNPDGLQRFSTWVNSRKSKRISADPNDMEHNEPWPSGRTNHYWFDLNRDWLVAQQPESQARIKKFHEWKPNLLTDHHEMGTNSTFFFQPGVPSRNHPLTPSQNTQLTRKMGEYHAKALDEIGSLYYTQEGFDDFYYGKGSTFPDIQGSVGILFEQASARGHAQESDNGVLKFPFAIRNQFTTALSSLRAINALRIDFLNYQRQFYRDAVTEASKDAVKSIIVGSSDRARLQILARIISQHEINLYVPSADQLINGKTFKKASSFVVPLNQTQYKLIKSMFEKRSTFTDSLFYDISSWTLPLAAGVVYEELKTNPASTEKFDLQKTNGKLVDGKSQYAYAFDPSCYFTPRAIQRLLDQNIRIKIASAPFSNDAGKKFERGSVLIPLAGQEKSPAVIDYVINEILSEDGIDIYAFNSGLDYSGTSLGSNYFSNVRKPEVAILVDGGVSSNSAGEIWHLLDVTFKVPVTMMPISVFNSAGINRYNVIILPPGSYSSITDGAKEKLKTWIQNGGVVIGFENALNWLHTHGIGKFEMKKATKKDSVQSRPYSSIEFYQGAQETSGAIFEVAADLTHPLLYGYSSATFPVFKSTNLFLEKSKNPYANPLVYKPSPLLSGYISKQNYNKVKDASYAGVAVVGKGRVIGFTENLNFRAFWFGTNRMLMNAIYFGNLIDDASGR
jgi:hypothetical protein